MSYFTKTALIILFIILLIPFGAIIDTYNTQCKTISFLQHDILFLQKKVNRLEPYENKYNALYKSHQDLIYEASEWQRLAFDRNIK